MANHDPSQSSKEVNVFYCTHITKLVLTLSCFFSSSILSSCSSITDSHSVRQLVREVSSLCSPSSWDLGRKRGKEGGGGGIRREKRREERRGRRGKEERRSIFHQCEALPTAYTRYIWRYTPGLLWMCTILPKPILTIQYSVGADT